MIVRRHLLTWACGALVALAGACDGDGARDTNGAGRRSEQPRGTVARRAARRVPTDTTSLVTPLRGDSLIGAARGAGGVLSVRTECAACHPTSHEVRVGSGPAAAMACVECHERAHETVQAFYAGAIRGTDVYPDTMFAARVACSDCHVDSTFATRGTVRVAALDAMCTSCHGTRFAGMLTRWQQGLAWRDSAVGAYVAQAAADGRLGGGATAVRVRHADDALQLLRTAGALHNLRGAHQLLRAALDSTSSAYARAGLATPPRPSLGPDPARDVCMSCHYGVEAARATVGGERFEHSSHVLRAGLRCSECHSDATFFVDGRSGGPNEDKDIDPRHGRTTVTAASCSGCHHGPTQRLACAACHADASRLGQPMRVTMPLALRPANATTRSRVVPFSHPQHSEVACASCHTGRPDVRTTASCSSCHQEHHAEKVGSCTQCHGTTAQRAHTRDDHFRCASCHTRETIARLLPERPFCLSCHVTQVAHQPGKDCASCHMQSTPAALRQRILSASATR